MAENEFNCNNLAVKQNIYRYTIKETRKRKFSVFADNKTNTNYKKNMLCK